MTDSTIKATTFYDRYAAICEERDINPCGSNIAADLHISKATISSWKTAKNIPTGDIVKRVADRFSVSSDYLLGRTPDSTDYTRGKRASVPEALIRKLGLLDDIGLIKVEAYIDGLLSQRQKDDTNA